MSLDKIVTLNEIIELAGDIPAEGILRALGRAVYKAKKGELSLIVDGQMVDGPHPSIDALYVRFHPTEKVEETFAYLFTAAGDTERAERSYTNLVDFLERRSAYGMAGDAAMEAHQRLKGSAKVNFMARAQALYETQIKKMDREPAGERNEHYYDEMLHKAGRIEEFTRRKQEQLKYWLGRGEFSTASRICGELGKEEDAERYRKLHELLKI